MKGNNFTGILRPLLISHRKTRQLWNGNRRKDIIDIYANQPSDFKNRYGALNTHTSLQIMVYGSTMQKHNMVCLAIVITITYIVSYVLTGNEW